MIGLALGACAKNDAEGRRPGRRGGRGSGQLSGFCRQCRRSGVLRDQFDRIHVDRPGDARPSRRAGSTSTDATPSRSRGTPTNAARANIISRSAPAAPRSAKDYPDRAGRFSLAHRRRSAMARSGRSPCATTFRAGRKTAAPSRCSPALRLRSGPAAGHAPPPVRPQLRPICWPKRRCMIAASATAGRCPARSIGG